MIKVPIARAAAAEALGTALLVATIVGSGIMALRLCSGNIGLALLVNTLATGGALVALITCLAPVSGAHFNPVVSLMEAVGGRLSWPRLAPFVVAQSGGAIGGAIVANLMFGVAWRGPSTTIRTGAGQWLGECVATFGLLAVIRGCGRSAAPHGAFAVAGWIVAAILFTSSTSFANPAVTLGRCFSDTFAGIRPVDLPMFVVCQVAATAAAALIFPWLFPGEKE